MSNGFQAFVICATPRCGSTLLCRLLAATGVAGQPGSHFHRPSVAAWCKSLGVETDMSEPEEDRLKRVFAAAIAKGRGDSPLFGLRLQGGSLPFFLDQLARLHSGVVGDVARIEASCGRTLFLHLARADKTAQAISYVKAQQTGLWHLRSDGQELERLSPPAEPRYDFAALEEARQTSLELDRLWEAWFESQRITPVRLTYEALSDRPGDVLRGILAALGQNPDAASGVAPDVARLSDATNAEWKARFERDVAARPERHR